MWTTRNIGLSRNLLIFRRNTFLPFEAEGKVSKARIFCVFVLPPKFDQTKTSIDPANTTPDADEIVDHFLYSDAD